MSDTPPDNPEDRKTDQPDTPEEPETAPSGDAADSDGGSGGSEAAEETVISADQPYTKMISRGEGDATVIATQPVGGDETVIGEKVDVSLGDLKPTVSMEGLAYNHYALAGEETKNYLLVNLESGYEGGDKLGRAPLSLALVLDKSGSMEGEPWERLLMAVRYIADQLTPADNLGIVVFDEYVQTLVEPTSVMDREDFIGPLADVTPRGTTNLHAGLTRGIGLLKDLDSPETVDRVLLLTDGDVNEGVTEYQQIVMEARNGRTYDIGTTTMGLGIEYNEELLTGVSKHGAGNYYYIETPEQLAEAFEEEMDSLIDVVATGVSLEFELGDGVRFDHLYGWEPTQTANKIEVQLSDLTADDEVPVLMRVKLEGDQVGEETEVGITLDFKYSGSETRETLSEKVVYTYTDERQKLLDGVNKAVEKIMREKDVVEQLSSATQMLSTDPAEATRMISQAQAELPEEQSESAEATMISEGVEKVESGSTEDATKMISEGVFALERKSGTETQALDLEEEAESARKRAAGEPEEEEATPQAGMEPAGEGALVGVLDQVSGGARFEVHAGGTYTIGRKDADFEVEDRYISRTHGELRGSDTGVDYRDLESTNGSVIDGESIPAKEWHELKPGEVLTVGESSFRFERMGEELDEELPGLEEEEVEPREEAFDIERERSERYGGETEVEDDGGGTAGAEVAAAEAPLSETSGGDSETRYVLRRESDGKEFPVYTGETRYGRGGGDCDVVITDDQYISRLHFSIEVGREGTLSIIDRGSTNGTTVERRELEPQVSHPLNEKDRVEVGQTTLELVDKKAEPPGDAPEQPEEDEREPTEDVDLGETSGDEESGSGMVGLVGAGEESDEDTGGEEAGDARE